MRAALPRGIRHRRMIICLNHRRVDMYVYAASDNICKAAAENVKMWKSGNVKEKTDRLANQINSNRIDFARTTNAACR